jgi:hypothetical protein
MVGQPIDQQLKNQLNELESLIGDFRHGATIKRFDAGGKALDDEVTPPLSHLFRLLAATWSDGHRRNARPTEGSPETVKDENNVPIPPRSDPVGELAVNEHRVNEALRYQAECATRGLAAAVGDLRLAKTAMVRALAEVKAEDGDPGCRCHLEIGEWLPVYRREHCRWCYGFSLQFKTDPPVELVRIKAEGGRITEDMIKAALRRPPRNKSKRKKAA